MSKIKTIDRITPKILDEMFNQELLAIRVPNYIDLTLCDELSKWFIQAKNLECYHHDIIEDGNIKYIDYGVDRLGVSYNIIFGKDENSAEYKQYWERTTIFWEKALRYRSVACNSR